MSIDFLWWMRKAPYKLIGVSLAVLISKLIVTIY